MPSTLLVIAIAVFDYSNGHDQKLTLEQLDNMTNRQGKSCPENMEWTFCLQFGPTCNNHLRPHRWLAMCRAGCQCKDGFYESYGRCVSDCSKEKCPGPNEIRSNCTAWPLCQPNCFIRKETKNISNNCEESCLPTECECEKGYIRVYDGWGMYKCISLPTCEKLKKQYGSALPSDFKLKE
ncbi:unnamed protein product [Cylicocyclus nassatus]|uniref:TIL domain-containing protein n=1 Tax=Cylicocyclus nassatus TaxID=53992 RepID=A0AA36GN85_CYLNA|nr:unnamed protein product [Cylicocyclus nassatus]